MHREARSIAECLCVLEGMSAVSIKCLKRIGRLLDAHLSMNIQLLQLPRAILSVSFKRAKQLALKAICIANLRDIKELYTIKDQNKKTKKAIVIAQAEQWHQMLYSSLIYKTALTKPPNERSHPMFLVRQEAVKFSYLTICTLYQIITKYIFIGSYIQWFFPQHTRKQVACLYSEPVQTIEHVLLKHPLYTTACHKHLTASGHPQNLSQLFNHPKCIHSLLQFLEKTGACAKPYIVWELE